MGHNKTTEILIYCKDMFQRVHLNNGNSIFLRKKKSNEKRKTYVMRIEQVLCVLSRRDRAGSQETAFSVA